MAKNTITPTIAEEKLALQITSTMDKAASTYGRMAELVKQFILDGAPAVDKDGFVARCKVLYATKAYKASLQQAAIRKAIQRMRHDAYGKGDNGKTGNAQTVKKDAKAKEEPAKVVEKITLPAWAFGLKPIVEQWAKQNPTAAFNAIRAALEKAMDDDLHLTKAA